MLVFQYRCFQEKTESNPIFVTNKNVLIERRLDSIFISFELDSSFYPIGNTTATCGADYSFGYSDKNDSLYIMYYGGPVLKQPFDSILFKERVYRKSTMFKNNRIEHMSIETRNEKIYARYYETGELKSCLRCHVYDDKNNLSFALEYPVTETNVRNVAIFDRLCTTFSFDIRAKK
jgi:hypothetical protein